MSFIVGEEGRLRVFTEEPRVSRGKTDSGKPYELCSFLERLESGLRMTEHANVSRGKIARCVRSKFTGRMHYAVVLPPDVEPELHGLDREISDAEARLAKLRAERQALLLAAAQRGEAIRMPKAGAS